MQAFKKWQIRIKIGEEVIKRLAAKTASDAAEDVLHSIAVKIAQDEGYDLDRRK